MRLLARLPLLLSFRVQVALAQVISVDGERFTKKFVGKPPGGDKLLEFVRENESFEQWTQLVGSRSQQFRGLVNDPVQMAFALAQKVKASNPKAQSSVITNKDKTEAIVD